MTFSDFISKTRPPFKLYDYIIFVIILNKLKTISIYFLSRHNILLTDSDRIYMETS